MDEIPDEADGITNDEVNSFMLLFECQSSKKQINYNSTIAKLPSVLEQELIMKVVGDGAKLVLDVDQSLDHPRRYLLQRRYSTQWTDFIDVVSPIAIASSVEAIPLSPKTSAAESVVSHLCNIASYNMIVLAI
jgi:hypothetical protein